MAKAGTLLFIGVFAVLFCMFFVPMMARITDNGGISVPIWEEKPAQYHSAGSAARPAGQPREAPPAAAGEELGVPIQGEKVIINPGHTSAGTHSADSVFIREAIRSGQCVPDVWCCGSNCTKAYALCPQLKYGKTAAMVLQWSARAGAWREVTSYFPTSNNLRNNLGKDGCRPWYPYDEILTGVGIMLSQEDAPEGVEVYK